MPPEKQASSHILPEHAAEHSVASVPDLLHRATHDKLTGLYNFEWLNENLPTILEENKGEVALLFMDLDGLKQKNDTEGHEAGNQLLRDTAKGLEEAVRHDGVYQGKPRSGDVIRYAGDEFIVILRGVKDEKGLETAKARVQEKLHKHKVEASIGSLIHTDESADEFVKKADQAMSAIKKQRKLEKYSDEVQQKIARDIGALAAEHAIDLRDLPALLEALQDQDKKTES